MLKKTLMLVLMQPYLLSSKCIQMIYETTTLGKRILGSEADESGSGGEPGSWAATSNPFVKIRHTSRLIVLAQPSSAVTECVFSQLYFIRRVCGNVMLEDVVW
jgi:hypothetical protein